MSRYDERADREHDQDESASDDTVRPADVFDKSEETVAVSRTSAPVATDQERPSAGRGFGERGYGDGGFGGTAPRVELTQLEIQYPRQAYALDGRDVIASQYHPGRDAWLVWTNGRDERR